jgi:hypothetical protein
MHDPFQTYSSLMGLYQNPYAINPLTAMGIQQGMGGGWGQQPQQSGFPGYGGLGGSPFHPWQIAQQPQQLYGSPQGQQNPYFGGGQHPLQHLAQHPLLALALQNPLLNPVLAQQFQSWYPQIAAQYGYGAQGGQPFGQGISPQSQVGNPLLQTGYPLAPQTWIGQQGLGGIFSQLGGRGLQGMSPWGGF